VGSRRAAAPEPRDENPGPEVSVTDTGNAVARDGAAAVTGLSGLPPEPGTSVHVSGTGNAAAAAGGNANTGYQHIENLYVVQPPLADLEPPPGLQIPGWAVPRTDELEEIVAAVCARPGAAVGITTGLEGAGGFGKTMLAEMACADGRVCEHFEGRIYAVTIGRDVRGTAAIAAKVIEAIRFITGHAVTYTDPGMAGDELGRLLDQYLGRRILLMLDDVWDADQLDPFLRGGRDCVRLITTRVPEALPDGAARVRVDQMTQGQAQAVLGQDLPPLPEHLVRGLIAAAGRWPLLLRLANRWMWRQVQAGADIAAAAEDMLALLREEGPAAVDRSRPPPDPADPVQRTRLVRATMQAATGLLTPGDQQCLAELGIFAEDDPVPVPVAARLWQATTGLNEPRSRDLCYELGSLSLLTIRPGGRGFLVLHDVIRDYLRHELGSDRITALNAALTDAIQDDLPPAKPLTTSVSGPHAAWWTLAENPDSTPADTYLADHAISHLLAAGHTSQAEAVACDIRWVEARLHQHGPAAPWSDCTRIPTESCTRRARDLAQAAHLLAPTEPAHALTAVLHSRLGPLPGWHDQVATRQFQLSNPALRNHWPLPDLPRSGLVRVLDSGPAKVTDVAVVPNGTWLATGGDDGTVRIWDVTTGQQVANLTGHKGDCSIVAVAPDGTWLAIRDRDDRAVRVWDAATGQQTSDFRYSLITATAVAPDGSWLAVVGYDGMVRIWDPATGRQITTLPFHHVGVPKMAVAPDGTWLATGGYDGMVRIWDPAVGRQTGILTGSALVTAVAVAPDGTWLAAGDLAGTVRIWDVTIGRQTSTLTGCKGKVTHIAVAPDGSWLATTDWGNGWTKSVQIWDTATSRQTGTLTGYNIRVAAVAPNGSWLATIGRWGKSVRIWDPATSRQIGTLTGHNSEVTAVVVASDGSWLATACRHDRTVRIWDTVASQQTAAFPGHTGKVTAMAIAPDGTWLATADGRQGVRIWDTATGQQTATLPGHTGQAEHMVAAPDGTWLATAGRDGMVRIWDPASGQQTASFTVHDGSMVTAMAIAPGGTWLATAGGWDKTVRIWDIATGQQTAILPGHMGQVTAITVAPDSTWLATTDNGGGGTARMWDLAAGQATRIRPFQMPEPAKLAIAPGSTWLATASGREGVQIWDAATGQQTATLNGCVPRLDTMAIAPDGTWLALVTDEQTIQIWDPVTGALVSTLAGHSDKVIAVAVNPDGTHLATADDAGAIRIWDKASGQVLTMMRTDGMPLSCTWMPDGVGLVVISEQGMHIYKLHLDPYA
jgi:WD40 repeat protein